MADLNTNVRYIKGIGETRAKALEKLGVRTLRDLIGFFPRRYEDRSVIYPIAELPVGERPRRYDARRHSVGCSHTDRRRDAGESNGTWRFSFTPPERGRI